jgi:hypothetical protein
MAKQRIAPTKNMRNDLAAEYLRSILDYNQETGEFRWRCRSDVGKTWNKKYPNKIAGRINYLGYWQIGINNILYSSHRLAWLYMSGEWPKDKIDHRDLNPSNNKWNNLREASDTQNKMNTSIKKSNKSGFKGVIKISDKYRAAIRINGIKTHLGHFNTPEEAHEAYCNAAREYFGEFAREK